MSLPRRWVCVSSVDWRGARPGLGFTVAGARERAEGACSLSAPFQRWVIGFDGSEGGLFNLPAEGIGASAPSRHGLGNVDSDLDVRADILQTPCHGVPDLFG